MAGKGLFQAQFGRLKAVVLHSAAPAQRDGHPAHGPCLQPNDHGWARPLPPHEGRQRAVGARPRPRRHRHADRGRAPDESPRAGQARRWARGVCQARVEVEGGVGRRHQRPDEALGQLLRLGSHVLHHGRQSGPSRGGGVRAPKRDGPDLPQQAPGQLGSRAQNRDLRLGGRQGRRAGQHVEHFLQVQG